MTIKVTDNTLHLLNHLEIFLSLHSILVEKFYNPFLSSGSPMEQLFSTKILEHG